MHPIVSSLALFAALTFGGCESATAPEPMAARGGPPTAPDGVSPPRSGDEPADAEDRDHGR